MGMMAVIIVNVVVLALRYDGEPEAWTLFQDTMNEICTVIFTAEAAVKIYAFGPTGYWTTKWNRFDLFIVVTSWVDLALRVSTWGEDMDPVGFRLIRIIRVVGRISRIFKASRKFKSTEILIDTFRVCFGWADLCDGAHHADSLRLWRDWNESVRQSKRTSPPPLITISLVPILRMLLTDYF